MNSLSWLIYLASVVNAFSGFMVFLSVLGGILSVGFMVSTFILNAMLTANF